MCYNNLAFSHAIDYTGAMIPTIKTYLIVCPFVFLAGLVDAIGGGGGLISLPAYLLSGLPPAVAAGTIGRLIVHQ